MIEIKKGNLLKSDVEALVNTVNTEGVMGRGIAAQFKRAYPKVFSAYKAACDAGEVKLGRMHVVPLGELGGGPKWVINFPTKGHWRAKSRVADIKAGLFDLVRVIDDLGIQSIAVPPLGCGNGGLDWGVVRPVIEDVLSPLADVRVLLYPPDGAPDSATMPNGTSKPKMTKASAAVVALMDQYVSAMLDPTVRLLEIHKLVYFLQEAGEPLRLPYVKHNYGPYSTNLRHVLARAEGHWLVGFGDGHDNPKTQLVVKDGAVEEAEAFLRDQVDTKARMARVGRLISGFEDPYGLELLSTVHWAMCHDPVARDDAEGAIRYIWAWSDRKAQTMKSDHIEKAWARLKAERWDSESLSAIH